MYEVERPGERREAVVAFHELYVRNVLFPGVLRRFSQHRFGHVDPGDRLANASQWDREPTDTASEVDSSRRCERRIEVLSNRAHDEIDVASSRIEEVFLGLRVQSIAPEALVCSHTEVRLFLSELL